MEASRRSLEAGRGIPIEEIRAQLGIAAEPRRRKATSGKQAAAPKRTVRKKRSR
jgi:hypothetical protein